MKPGKLFNEAMRTARTQYAAALNNWHVKHGTHVKKARARARLAKWHAIISDLEWIAETLSAELDLMEG